MCTLKVRPAVALHDRPAFLWATLDHPTPRQHCALCRRCHHSRPALPGPVPVTPAAGCEGPAGRGPHTVLTPSMLRPTPIHMSPGSTARSSTVTFRAAAGSALSSCAGGAASAPRGALLQAARAPRGCACGRRAAASSQLPWLATLAAPAVDRRLCAAATRHHASAERHAAVAGAA